MIESDQSILFGYRAEQAETTLAEAEKMLDQDFSARSIVNRAYYAMFYMTLALFLKTGVRARSSKHSGILAIFDREFVNAGKIDRVYSQMIHQAFDRRIDFDYKEGIKVRPEDAPNAVHNAREFIAAIRRFLDESHDAGA